MSLAATQAPPSFLLAAGIPTEHVPEVSIENTHWSHNWLHKAAVVADKVLD